MVILEFNKSLFRVHYTLSESVKARYQISSSNRIGTINASSRAVSVGLVA